MENSKNIRTAERLNRKTGTWKGCSYLYKVRTEEGECFLTASSILNIISGPETAVFKSPESGFVDWSSVAIIKELDPDRAIEETGFKVISPPLGPLKVNTFQPLFEDLVKPGNLIRIVGSRFTHSRKEGIWDPDNINFPEFMELDTKTDIEKETLLLLKQPAYKINFKLIFLEVLSGKKVYTCIFDLMLSNTKSNIDHKTIFEVVK